MRRAMLREELAELEHTQWMTWSKDLAKRNALSKERLDRWQKLWIPYSELSELEKDMDRVWADEILKIVDTYLL
jgi:hypothetical protein